MSSTTTIEERLARLERENRRLKLAGFTLVIGVIGIISGGASSFETVDQIKTRNLVIVGADDKPRIDMVVFPDGAAAVRLFKPDDQGKPVAVLAVSKDGFGEIILRNQQQAQSFHAP